MKKRFYFLLMLFLALAQNGWSQCNGTVSQSETFDVQGDMNTGEITVRFENLAEDTINFSFNPAPSLPPYNGPSSTPPNVIEYKIPYSYACPGGTFPYQGLPIEIVVEGKNGCTQTLTWILTSEYACGDSGTSSTPRYLSAPSSLYC